LHERRHLIVVVVQRSVVVVWSKGVWSFFCGSGALFNKRREEKKTLFVEKFVLWFFVCLRSFRLLRHFDVKSQPLLDYTRERRAKAVSVKRWHHHQKHQKQK
jgi:hypothetical protein